MSELTGKTTHYIVHSTVRNPLLESTYGTSAPYSGPGALDRAIKAAHREVQQDRRAFVTARDDKSSILAVIPVVIYPAARETHVPGHVQDAITDLFTAI